MKILGNDYASTYKRFHFMANFAGVMSLLLWFVYMPAKYLSSDHHAPKLLLWIVFVHGYQYLVYLITAFHYSLISKKNFGIMIVYLLAGTLPFASFVADRKATKESLSRS